NCDAKVRTQSAPCTDIEPSATAAKDLPKSSTRSDGRSSGNSSPSTAAGRGCSPSVITSLKTRQSRADVFKRFLPSKAVVTSGDISNCSASAIAIAATGNEHIFERSYRHAGNLGGSFIDALFNNVIDLNVKVFDLCL